MPRRTPHIFRTLGGLTAAGMLCGGVLACAERRDGERGRDGSPLVVQIGTALPRGVPSGGVPAVVNALISEPLVSADRSGRVQPRLAARWEWAESGTALRFTLPERTRFHDGTPVDAAAVAEILRREFRPESLLSASSVAEVDAPQPDLVVLRLRQIDAFVPEDLAHISIAKGTTGTAAFMVEDSSASVTPKPKDSPARLIPFPGYRHGRSEVQRVEVRAHPTLRSAWTAMMRGEINMLYEVGREAADFVEQQSASVRSYSFLRPYVFNVKFNLRHPVLGRREVRQALSEAIDRDAIVRDAMRGRGEPADGPVWKYHWAYSTAQRSYRHNPAASRLRLDAAGLVPTASPGAMPSRLAFTCLVWGDDPRFERVALVLQKQLYDVGVDMRVEAVTTTQLIERMNTGRYDAYLMERISGPSLNWIYQAWRTPEYPSAAAALERLRRAITPEDTREAVGEVQRVFYDDPPALFLAWPMGTRAVSVDIEVPPQPDSDIVGRIWRFRRAAAEAARR